MALQHKAHIGVDTQLGPVRSVRATAAIFSDIAEGNTLALRGSIRRCPVHVGIEKRPDVLPKVFRFAAMPPRQVPSDL